MILQFFKIIPIPKAQPFFFQLSTWYVNNISQVCLPDFITPETKFIWKNKRLRIVKKQS